MKHQTRERALAGAFEVLRSGQTVTLDSTARQVGLTKPGLMYHFPTKESLMLGLTEFVARRWVDQLTTFLKVPFDASTPADRIRAYVELSFSDDFDETELVMLADPRLRTELSARWASVMSVWVEVPADLDPAASTALIAARLMADGAWLASSLNMFVPSDAERVRLRKIALSLLEEHK